MRAVWQPPTVLTSPRITRSRSETSLSICRPAGARKIGGSRLAQKLRTVDRLERVVDDASALDAAANALRLDVRITALELDQLVPTELWQWLGPGAIQMETRFVDAASGRVVLVTADRRTARTVMTQARDISETTARLDEAANYLVMDLVNFLSRVEKTAAHT